MRYFPRNTALLLLFIFTVSFGSAFLIKISIQPEFNNLSELNIVQLGSEFPLPQRWHSATRSQESRQFEFNLLLDKSSIDEISIFVPSFERNLQVSLNGADVTESGDIINWKGPLSSGSALIPLPPDILQEGPNELNLSVTTESGSLGSLSEIYVGSENQLQPYFNLRFFLEQNLKLMIFTLQATLALSSLVFSILRPGDRRFALLGISMILACTVTMGVFSDVLSPLSKIVSWALVLVSSGGITFLAFVYELERQKNLKWLLGLAVAIPAISYLVVLTGFYSLREVVIYTSAPISAFAFSYASFVLGVGLWQRPTADRIFLFSGLVLLIFAIGHDILLKLRFIEGGVLIAQSAWLLTLIGVIIFLMSYLAKLATDLDGAALWLKEKLQQREEELAIAFEREKKVVAQIAIQSQRDRIMADLHDGVAGHLSTIVALSDKEELDSEQIQVVARHALADLRIVIDALVLNEGTLLMSLASLRDKFVTPLERLDIEISWCFANFPEVIWLSPDQTLSVLRILQEAISNAVRHGRPKRLVVKGKKQCDKTLTISIINSGGASFVRTKTANQYGLKNVEQRADQLGGKIEIISLPDGAIFKLTLPLCPV